MSDPKTADRCLIFDFDGTVADTIELGREIFNEMAPDYGYRPVKPEEVDALRDLSTAQFIKHCQVPKRKLPAILTEGKRRLAERMPEIRPIDGMAEVLPRLREQFTVLGILTSNDKVNVRLFSRCTGWKFLILSAPCPSCPARQKPQGDHADLYAQARGGHLCRG